jgi:hypothetical protein
MILTIILGYLGVTTALLLGLMRAAAYADRIAPVPKRGGTRIAPLPEGMPAR